MRASILTGASYEEVLSMRKSIDTSAKVSFVVQVECLMKREINGIFLVISLDLWLESDMCFFFFK